MNKYHHKTGTAILTTQVSTSSTKSPSFGGVGEANRNRAYFSITEKLPQKRQRIYAFISQCEPCTALEISDNYHIPINEVVGRITELKNYFLIVEAGSKTNLHTGKKNTIYRITKSDSERIDLINQRFVELRNQKEQLERDFHLGISPLTRDLILKETAKINVQIHQLGKILDASPTPPNQGLYKEEVLQKETFKPEKK